MRVAIFLTIFLTAVFATTFEEELQNGVSYYKQKQYERALEVFDRLMIENPDSQRVRLEYARVLYAIGKYDEAKKIFIQVLNQNPPLVVQKNIKWFIKKCESKQKTNFFSGSVSLGSTSDSNIENKSDNPIYAGYVDANPNKRKDNFITTEISLNHTKKLKNALWQNSLYIYNESAHDKKEDKVTFYSLQTAYRFLYSGVRVSLPLTYSQTDIGGQKYVTSIMIAPNIQKRVSKSSMLSLGVKYKKNKNQQDSEKDSKVLGIDGRYFFRYKKLSSNFGLGYEDYKRVRGDRLDIAKKRYSFDLGASYPLMESNLLSLFFKNIKDSYKEEDPTILKNREDTQKNLSIDIKQFINKRRFFSLGFSRIENSSNIEFYSYDKNIFSIKATQRF